MSQCGAPIESSTMRLAEGVFARLCDRPTGSIYVDVCAKHDRSHISSAAALIEFGHVDTLGIETLAHAIDANPRARQIFDEVLGSNLRARLLTVWGAA